MLAESNLAKLVEAGRPSLTHNDRLLVLRKRSAKDLMFYMAVLSVFLAAELNGNYIRRSKKFDI